MNLACPRCHSANLTLGVQAMVTYRVDPDPADERVTLMACHSDTDSFQMLKCQSCHLTLGCEAGDGRLRRASLYDTDDNWANGTEALLDGLNEQAMHDIAAEMIRRANT